MTASPSSSSHDDQPRLMNRMWAKNAPTGPQGLAGGSFERISTPARGIGGVVSPQAQAQEHDRQGEGNKGC